MIDHSLRLLKSETGLRKSKDVVGAVRNEHDIKVSSQYVCTVLTKDLGIGYKAIKRIPFKGNSTRCLALRQKYAQYMLSLLESGIRVINIDQTWIGDTNFTRRRWR